MSTTRTLPPRPPCCFTAPFLAGYGEPEEMDALRRAGEILFRDRECADLPPGKPESLETGIRRRLLLAANDLEALGTWLAQEVEFDDLDTPVLAYLASHAEQVGSQLGTAAEGLRLAVLADDETALRLLGEAPPPAPPVEPAPGPVAAYQQLLSRLAATARGWMSKVRRAAATLEPLIPPDEATRNAFRESGDYEPLALDLFDSGDHLAEEIAGVVAYLTVYAEETEDRRSRLPHRDVAALAEEIYLAPEPAAAAGAEPPPPVESFRADCQTLAGALRPWLSHVRAAGRRLESLLPEESERDALREAQSETLPLHLYDMTWFVNQALSRLVATLESLAVATEDRATWRGPDETTARADQVWSDLNGEDPAPHGGPEGGDSG